jgi:hypothetical protein
MTYVVCTQWMGELSLKEPAAIAGGLHGTSRSGLASQSACHGKMDEPSFRIRSPRERAASSCCSFGSSTPGK